MRRVQEIESAIDSLAEDEYSELRDWFWERDWAKWDREIEADAASGKLDLLLQEARDGKTKKALPLSNASHDGAVLAAMQCATAEVAASVWDERTRRN